METQSQQIPWKRPAPGHQVEYRGVAIEYGRSHLIVPCISLEQAECLTAEADRVADVTQDWAKRRDAMTNIVTEALKLNYPEMPEAEVKRFLRFENIHEAYSAAMGFPGDKVHQAPGEPPAAAQQNGATSTGAGSAAE